MFARSWEQVCRRPASFPSRLETLKASEAFKIHETEVPHGSSLTWLMGVLGGVLVPISVGLGTIDCLSAIS